MVARRPPAQQDLVIDVELEQLLQAPLTNLKAPRQGQFRSLSGCTLPAEHTACSWNLERRFSKCDTARDTPNT
eukprot:379447-Pleurochrysis_carterae.AAC.1